VQVKWSVRALKRTVDVVAASLGLGVTLPLLPLIALALFIDSPGPILFRQRRAGRLLGRAPEGRGFRFVEFTMYKFRSMRLDAERHTGAVLASEGDPRVTRVGRILRKTRLDELPQLVNVLLGDMSLVGPRPERPELIGDLAMAIPYFEERMRGVKPGITGLAQISLGYSGNVIAGSEIEPFHADLANPFALEAAEGAEADDMRMKLLYDMAYAASLERPRTYLRMELEVLARTPLVMVRGLGR
jgi:lipopolysaccharide/colanic/teichoic acid biosynthesis glycosyltransferase